VWHKIDLVRVRDRYAAGGWRYYAHLLTHQPGYQSPATQARRCMVPAGRRAGVDANVSNLSVASFPDAYPERLVVGQVSNTAEELTAATRAVNRAGHGSAPWTAHDATPTRISMGCRRARPHALRAAQHVGWCPSR
jgi:hypothetical protein